MDDRKEKVCFVMQQVTKGTHMDYVYEMARSLREDEGLPITLLIEKGECRAGHTDWCVAQRFRFTPLRILENFILLARMRANGHRTFYIHYSFLSVLSAGIITKLFGGRVLYWNCGMPWNYERGFFEESYQKLAYKLIDKLVTGAGALVEGYTSTYGLKREQIVVIPNWIDLEHLPKDESARQKVCDEHSIPEDAKILLFVHALVKRKGADLLPDILNEINDESVHLLVAGDGNEHSHIETKCAEYGLSDRVHMLGYVGRTEVEELLQAADVFVMPSAEEGSPHSLIEAMAYGLPFVAFDVGGVKDTAPPQAAPYIRKYPDIQNMAHDINALLQDEEKHTAFQVCEREWVARFDKLVIVQKYKSLLTEKMR